jgi:uroporphyrinogen decarboxylase
MKPVYRALTGTQECPPPIWLMRQAGRYLPEYRKIRKTSASFIDLCLTPDWVTEATLQPIQRFDFDAAILFSDILLIPHLLGQDVSFEKGEGPKLAPIDLLGFVKEAYKIDLLEKSQPVFQAIKQIKNQLSDKTTFIGFAGSPWTIATYMVELGKSINFSKIINLAKTTKLDPLITLLEDSVVTSLIAQINAGVDVVQIFDSWASMVPTELRGKYVIQPARNIITRIRLEFPNVPIIYYGKGVSEIYPEIIKDLSGVCLGVDQHVSPRWAAENLQTLAPIQGNLDPLLLLEGGVRMHQAIDEILNELSGGPFVFNLGHGILPETPLEHVCDLVERVRVQK